MHQHKSEAQDMMKTGTFRSDCLEFTSQLFSTSLLRPTYLIELDLSVQVYVNGHGTPSECSC